MVCRYLLRSVFLLFILLISANSVVAQEKEIPGGKDLQQIIKEADKALKEGRFSDYVQLAGAMGNIECLEPTYCSNTTSSVKLEPNSDWTIMGSTVRLDWEILHEGTPVTGVITSSGSGMSTEFYFHPYLVPSNLHGKTLLVNVYQLNSVDFVGTTMSDLISILKAPNVYDFSFDDGSLIKEICFGQNATLTLSNSEDNVRYTLLRDGNFSTTKDGSTGDSISFTITQPGKYSLRAANTGYGCPEIMNGEPELTVNPSPTPTITPILPICEGETIELRGKPDGMVFYSWTGPGIATSLDGQDHDLTDATKATHEGTYYLLVQDASGCEGSASINVVVNESPEVLLNNPGPFCEGDIATLTATASNGTAPYSYAWKKAGVLLPAETSSTLSFNPVSIVDAGDYSVIVSDAKNCATTEASTTLVVNENPTIVPITYSGDDCAGETFTFSTTASGGTGTYTYNWTLDGTPIGGNTAGISHLIATAGTYTVAVSVTDGNCTSNVQTQTVVVAPNPVADLQGPAGICLGGSETFDASATTGASNYEFILDGTTVQSSPANTYGYTPVVADIGSHTLVMVASNADGCADRKTLEFEVYPEPAATITLADAEICSGDNTTLTIELTTGSQPWSFVYNDGTNNIPVGPIAGTTHSITVSPTSDITYTLVSISDANSCGATPGTTASLVVNANPTVAIDGDNAVCLGESLTLIATASGGSGSYVQYNWFKDGVALSGNSATYTIPTASASHAGDYTVTVVDGKTCNGTSAPFNVTVQEATATLTASATEICAGSSVTFTAGGAGATGSYEFFVGGTSVQGPSASNIYTTSSLTNGVTVIVNIIDDNGCEDSESLSMTVYPEPTATISLADAEICSGDNTTLTIELTTGSQPWSFVYNDGTNNIPVGPIAGTTHSITVSPTSDITYTLVSISDANSCGATPGTTASLSVNANPTVTIAGDNIVCMGESLSLTATAAGGSGSYVQYNWFKDGVALIGNTDTYSIPATSPLDAGSYTVTVVDNNNCESTSATFDVTIQEATATLATPNTAVCAGSPVTFTADGAGLTGSYEFFINNNQVQVPSANNEYTTSSLSDNDEVLVKIVDENGCEATASVTMTVFSAPAATVAFADSEICAGSSVDLTFTLNTGTRPWNLIYNNGTENIIRNSIAGSSYTISVSPTSDVIYTLVSISDANSCGATPGSTASLVVNDNPTVTIAGDNTVCMGESLSLTATAAGGSGNYVQYDWFKDGVPLSGSSNTYEVTITSASDAGRYSVTVVDDNNCASTSADFDVVVNQAIATLSSSPTCVGEDVTFTAGGAGGGTYEFFVDGLSVQGPSTNNIYINSALLTGQVVSVNIIDDNGCADSTSETITIHPLPTATLSPSDPYFCAGTSIIFEGSGAVTGTYEFFVDDVSVRAASNDNRFETDLLTDGQKVTVKVVDDNGCEAIDETIVTVYPIPTIELTADPDSKVLEGTSIEFTASGGEEYEFYLNGTAVQPRSAQDNWNLTDPADGDTVVVIGWSLFDCEASDTIIVTVDTEPQVFKLLPTYSEYCDNSGGVQLYLENYETGVNYELFEVSTGTKIKFDDGQINIPTDRMTWFSVPEGRYIVVATSLGGLASPVEYTDTARVVMNESPQQFDMIPNATFTSCIESELPEVELAGSEVGIEYFVYVNGMRMSAIPTIGTGGNLNFGKFNVDGTYTVRGFDPITGCSSVMNGEMILNVASGNIYDLTTNNDALYAIYCADDDDAGVELKLSGSDNANSYTLWKNGLRTNNVSPGSGGEVLIRPAQKEGVYMVSTISGSCHYWMNNSVTIAKDPGVKPVVLSAENNGLFCEGDVADIEIYLDHQEANVIYTLVNSDESFISPLPLSQVDLAGPVAFPDLVSTIGTYYVRGGFAGGCDPVILDSIEINYDVVPTSYSVTVQGHLCGGDGIAVIELENSQDNVDYTLYFDDGVGFVEQTTEQGTNSPLSFIVADAGDYYISAYFNDNTSACSSLMLDTVTVENITLPIKEKDYLQIPGVDCDADTISIIDFEVDVVYELYFIKPNASMVGDTIPTGNIADSTGLFSPIEGNGEYLIYASREGCGLFLEIAADPTRYPIKVANPSVPDVYVIEGGDAVCEGDITSLTLSGSQDDVKYLLYRTSVDDLGNLVGSAALVDSLFAADIEAPGFSVVEDGYYSITATDTITECSAEMVGAKVVRFNKLPTSFRMIGSGFYCDGEGALLGLEGSEENVTYTLVGSDGKIYKPDADGLADGGPIYFDKVVNELTYRVMSKNNLTGCTSSMKGSVKVEPQASAPNTDKGAIGIVIPESGIYCSNESVVSIEITNPEVGVTYSLVDTLTNNVESYKYSTVEDQPISLVALDLSDDLSGTFYRLIASYADRGCESLIDTIRVNRMPSPGKPVVIFPGIDTLTVNVCPADSYFRFDKLPNVNYVIHLDGEASDTLDVSPTLESNFAYLIEESGFVSVAASYSDFSCTQMSKMYYFNIYPSVAEFNLSVPDIGYYCENDNGVIITIDSTVAGVYYELYKGEDLDPTAIIKGSGSKRSFAPVFGTKEVGTLYEVRVEDEGGCSAGSTQEVIIYEVPLPETPKTILTKPLDFGTRLILQNSEAPRMGDQWKDSVNYHVFIDINDDPLPSLDLIGTGADLIIGTFSGAGNADVFATRHWYVNEIEMITCTHKAPVETIIFGDIESDDDLVAENFYLYLQSGKQNVGTNMSQYVSTQSEATIDTSDLVFSFDHTSFDFDDPLKEDKFKLSWFPADGSTSGVNTKRNKLIKNNEENNVLGIISISRNDSISFSREVPALHGVFKIDYVVNRKSTSESAKATITIIVGNAIGVEESTFILPNAFSPNGDGINDYFVIDGLQNFKGVGENPLSSLEVFNRWGTVVYQSKGLRYGNAENGGWWDGTSNTGTMISIGKELPNGTYYYVFTVKFVTNDDRVVTKEFPGFVELRR